MAKHCNTFFTIFSSIICVFAFGSLYAWNHLNSYYIKYLNRFQPKSVMFTYESGFYLYLLAIFMAELSKILGVALNNQLGTKITICLSFVFVIFAHIFLYYFPQTITIYLGAILLGIGNGIPLFPIMKNCWKLLPKSKGIISGMLYCIKVISELFFIFFSEMIINPTHQQIDKANLTYNIDLGAKMKSYTVFCLVFYSITGIVAYFLITEEREISNVMIGRTTSINDVDNYLDEGKEKDKKTKGNMLVEELLSKKYLKIFAMQITLIYASYIILNGFMSYGAIHDIPTLNLKKLGIICSLMGIPVSLFWGIVLDCKGYKKKFKWLIVFQIVASIGIFFSVNSFYVYSIFVGFAYISFIGINVFFAPIYYIQFNQDFALEIIALSQFISSSAYIIIPMVLKKMANSSVGFFCFFFISFNCSIGAFIINEYFMYPKNTNKLKEIIYEKKNLRQIRVK